MNQALTGVQLIGFSTSRQGSQQFKAFDPQRQEWLEPAFTEATPEEIEEAVQLAAQAFEQYKLLPGKRRAEFLQAIAQQIEAVGDELLKTASAETGLPLGRLQNERGRTVNQLKLFATLLTEGSWVNARIDTAQPGTVPVPDIRQLQVPLGVVGVFGASNFPLAFSVAGGDTVAALAAGCPVVFKAHPAHPQTSQLVGVAIQRAAQETGMPEGVFSLVHGATNETGAYLVQHPLVAAVGFTGSFRGGKALYDLAVRREKPIPVYAEMSAVNPVFFLPEILKEKGDALAAQFVQSVTLGVGQFCTNPGVFLTTAAPQTETFVSSLQQQLSAAAGGPMLTPGILKAYKSGVQTLVDTYQAKVLAKPASEQDTTATPYLLEVPLDRVLKEPEISHEVFGPSSLHIKAGSMDELIAFARQMEGQLTATIHGTENDLKAAAPLVNILREKAGRLVINGFPTGVAVNHAMVHGGPYPATTPGAGTSVGTGAINRFTRPVCFQDFPAYLLPQELQDDNPLGIWRLVNGEWARDQIA